jgi:sec-independent protein translocase protein TatA
MGRIGGTEILLILLIALLIFGPSKLADMGKGLGEGLKNFKKGISQDGPDGEPNKAEPTTPAAPEPPKALPPGTDTSKPGRTADNSPSTPADEHAAKVATKSDPS